jgi:hypothetical protein
MPQFDYSHVAEAARKFIDALEEVVECIGVPGGDHYLLRLLVVAAWSELNWRLGGISYSRNGQEGLDSSVEVFTSGLDLKASLYIRTMKHNLPILLRWIGVNARGDINPSEVPTRPENVTAEFNAMCWATENLERIVAATRESEIESTPVPANPDGEGLQKPVRKRKKLSQPRPTTLEELAPWLRRKYPQRCVVAKFVEMIADRDEVDFDEIKSFAHEAVVEDSAVEKTVYRAKKAIAEARLTVTLTISRRRVIKS